MDSTLTPPSRGFSAKSRQAKLLVAFDEKPSTDFEATCKVAPVNGYQTRFDGTRRRCSDLRREGFLEDTGQRRRNPGSVDLAIIWRVTETGRAAIARLLATGWSR